MEEFRKNILLHIRLGGFLLIFTAVLFFTETQFKFYWEAIKQIPNAVTIYVIIELIFVHWAWKWKIFSGWIVTFPNLQGTWRGELKSSWINPETNQALAPIPVVLTIKQSFNSISCNMYTKESRSHSTVAQLLKDSADGLLKLNYNYTNRSQATLRDRSPIHDGAAILNVQSGSENKFLLQGEYWTSRKTTGDISMSFYDKKIIERFIEN